MYKENLNMDKCELDHLHFELIRYLGKGYRHSNWWFSGYIRGTLHIPWTITAVELVDFTEKLPFLKEVGSSEIPSMKNLELE